MQDREFERKVQEQMQGFDLEPSPEVWVGVEKRIRKEKKRRFVGWWIFAALLLGGAATYMALENGTKKPSPPLSVVSDTAKSITEQPVQPDKTNSEGEKEAENSNNIVSSKIVTGTQNNEKIISPVVSGNRKQKVNSGYGTGIKVSLKKNEATVIQSRKPEHNKDVSLSKRELQKDSVVPTEPVVAITAGKPGVATPIPPQPLTDSTVIVKNNGADQQVKQLVKTPAATDTSAAPEPITNLLQNKKKNKWETGISFFAGISNLDEGFRLGQNKSRENAFAVPNSVSPPMATVSVPKGNFSFQAGVFAKRKLSERLDFYTHLTYSYLSASLLTGGKSDTLPMSNLSGTNVSPSLLAANGYYRLATNTDRRQYINRFHYVDLTAGVSWRIINSKKFKLYWDNSIGYRRLLGSNMLHYSSTLPGYYRDNSLLRKNQFIFETGLMVPVSKKLQLSAFVSYTPSSVVKQNSDNKLHFTQFGIRLKYFLNKQ